MRSDAVWNITTSKRSTGRGVRQRGAIEMAEVLRVLEESPLRHEALERVPVDEGVGIFGFTGAAGGDEAALSRIVPA